MRQKVIFTGDVECVKIPSGDDVEVPEGTEGFLVQARSGYATIRIPDRMWQVQLTSEDLDHLENDDGSPVEVDLGESPSMDEVPDDMTGAVYKQLEQCYDPEIPVNIVDLGLVYDVIVEENGHDEYEVQVKMTLTAQGCGMGEHIARQAQQRIQQIPGVNEANVDIVWDPPWTQDMMSDEAKRKLGFV